MNKIILDEPTTLTAEYIAFICYEDKYTIWGIDSVVITPKRSPEVGLYLEILTKYKDGTEEIEQDFFTGNHWSDEFEIDEDFESVGMSNQDKEDLLRA